MDICSFCFVGTVHQKGSLITWLLGGHSLTLVPCAEVPGSLRKVWSCNTLKAPTSLDIGRRQLSAETVIPCEWGWFEVRVLDFNISWDYMRVGQSPGTLALLKKTKPYCSCKHPHLIGRWHFFRKSLWPLGRLHGSLGTVHVDPRQQGPKGFFGPSFGASFVNIWAEESSHPLAMSGLDRFL